MVEEYGGVYACFSSLYFLCWYARGDLLLWTILNVCFSLQVRVGLSLCLSHVMGGEHVKNVHVECTFGFLNEFHILNTRMHAPRYRARVSAGHMPA